MADSILTSYAPGSALLKAYIQANGIKAAFVFKEGNQQWQVYIGDAVARTGFKECEPFKTKRDALLHASKANRQIESVEQTTPLNLGA